MAQINKPITNRAFELIRDRIGTILTDELDNQFQITYDPALKVTTWMERFIPFDKNELPAINVTLARGSYNWQTVTETRGDYKFFIDCYVSARHGDGDYGDRLAMVNLQRLMGVIKAILENPIYKTLGFPTGAASFVNRRYIEEFDIENPNQKKIEAEHVAMGRMVLCVIANEDTPLTILGTLATSFQTTVKLFDTDRGYKWTI